MNTIMRVKRCGKRIDGVLVTHLRFIDKISVVEVILITGETLAYRYDDSPTWVWE